MVPINRKPLAPMLANKLTILRHWLCVKWKNKRKMWKYYSSFLSLHHLFRITLSFGKMPTHCTFPFCLSLNCTLLTLVTDIQICSPTLFLSTNLFFSYSKCLISDFTSTCLCANWFSYLQVPILLSNIVSHLWE